MAKKIPLDFYQREDVLLISQELLGKYLFTCIDGMLTGGIITETEAYAGAEDKASHAFGNRRTPRTEVFYKEGGVAYVYLCYGIHYLFNIITNKKDIPHAVLIRSIEPLIGIDIMLHRRNKAALSPLLTAGPGALSMALGISKKENGISLAGNEIWLEEADVIDPLIVVESPRVGIGYAEEYALKPWRFYIKDNKWVSKTR